MASGRRSDRPDSGRRTRPPRRRLGAVTWVGLLAVAAMLPAACSSGSGSAAGPTGSGPANGSSGSAATTEPALTLPPITPTTTTSPAGQPPQSPSAPTTAQTRLAGQRVIFSYSGLTPPADLLAVIRSGDAAGVIFFGDNIADPAQLASVVQELDQAQQQSPIHRPLLLMTDQEGGQVSRLPGPPNLSEEEIGQSVDPKGQASTAGTEAGQNLNGIGLNVNLAPVLDVYYQPGDFIEQSRRSYSSNPTVVSALGSAFISAQQHARVAATAKHFPGLGSAPAGANTDNAPVTLPVSLSQLRNTDEVPYQAAISAGVKLIMVSWAVYPALDSTRPAAFSPTVVQQELRGRLRYSGVTITDALEAGALNAYGTPGQRAQDAAIAGMDLILCSSGDVAQGQQASAGLANALASGQLSQPGFTAAVNRINSLRSSLP